MALARSASGPGGLSINTGSTNTLFGSNNTTQPAAPGGLFGAQATQSAGGLFGSSTNTSSAPPAGGLFGAPAATTPAGSAGGLFGSAKPATAAPSGGLFGSSTVATSAPAGGLLGSATASTQAPAANNLFGSATNTTTAAPAAGGLFGSLGTTASSAPAAGGLFGSTANPQPQQSGGLFGSSTSQPQQTGLFGSTATTGQSQQGAGLFGGQNQTSTPNNTGGMFGSVNTEPTQNMFGGGNNAPTTSLFGGASNAQPQQQQQQQQSSLFSGLNQSQQQPNVLGGLTMGQSQANQSSVPGVRIDISNLRSTTRFNDLHDDLQKEIENIDNIILRQMQLKQDCDAIMPSHDQQLSNVPSDVELLTRKASGVDDALQSDAQAIMAARKSVHSDAENAKLSFKAIDNLKLPPQYHLQSGSGAIWSSSKEVNGDTSGDSRDLVSFFTTTADDMSSKLEMYRVQLAEVEQHLRGMEVTAANQMQQYLLSRGSGGVRGPDVAAQQLELMAVLREFEDGVLAVAGNVGATRDGMQQLQLGGLSTTNGHSGTPVTKRKGIY